MRRWLAAGAAGVLAIATAASGHAGDGADPVLGLALDLTHLTAASVWLGRLALLVAGPLSPRVRAAEATGPSG